MDERAHRLLEGMGTLSLDVGIKTGDNNAGKHKTRLSEDVGRYGGRSYTGFA
jgi:hypothetical protein